jgi:hypothetical protein
MDGRLGKFQDLAHQIRLEDLAKDAHPGPSPRATDKSSVDPPPVVDLAANDTNSPSRLLAGLSDKGDPKTVLDDEGPGKGTGFTPDLLAAFRSFDCAKATRKACSLKASKGMPFSLAYLDEFWKETHGGKLPSADSEDVKGFSLAKWKYRQEAIALKAIEFGLPPPRPEPPTAKDLKKLYIPALDRRQFYCWKIRTDREFCRLLKVKAMEVAGADRKGLKACKRLAACLTCWASHKFSPKGLLECQRTHKCGEVMPYMGVDLKDPNARHRFAGLLLVAYKRAGGKLSREEMKAKGGLLVYLAALLRPPSTRGDSKSPIDLSVDPPDEKIRAAFCEAVAAIIEAKSQITYPPLDLPPAQYRAEIDRIFGRFAYAPPVFKNGCAWDSSKLTKLTQHQKFMGAYMTPDNPAKGVLMDHAAGTGKTCAGVAALSNFVALQKSPKNPDPWRVIWVTRPKLVPDVGVAVYDLGCLGVLRDAIRDDSVAFGHAKTFLAKLNYAKDKAHWKALENQLAHGFYLKDNVFKYSQLVNTFTGKPDQYVPGKMFYTQYGAARFPGGPDPLRKTLVIMDEAHNLFNVTDLPQSELQYMAWKRSGVFGQNIPGREHIVNMIRNSYRVSGKDSCRLMLATATPMTKSPVDAFRLLNLLIPDPKDHLPSTMEQLKAYRTKDGQPFTDENGSVTPAAREEFKARTNGLISYFAGNRNPEYFAMKEFHIVDVPVSSVQEFYFKDCATKYKPRTKRPAKKAGGDKAKPKGGDKAKPKPKRGGKGKKKDQQKLWQDLKRKLGISKPRKGEFFEGGPEGASYGENFHPNAYSPQAEFHPNAYSPQAEKPKPLPTKPDPPKEDGSPGPLPLTKPAVKVKIEKRKSRIKSVPIPDGLTPANLKKAQTCMRNRSILANITGKLRPLDKEAEAHRAAHHAKEAEREAKERAAFVKKNALGDDQMAKIKAWKEWEAMEDVAHPGPKPKTGADVKAWEEQEAKRKAKMAAKPKGRKPSKGMLTKYEATLRGDVGAGFGFKRKATPRPKEGKRFNFNFETSGTFTAGLLRDALASYGPKVQALLDKIAELDRRDLETHGRLFKHSIYTDTAGNGYGSKVVASIFAAFGFQRACSYKTLKDSTGKPQRNSEGDLLLELEAPEHTVGKCTGNQPPGPDTFAKGHTFCVLSTSSMGYLLDGKEVKDSSPSVVSATIDLFNSSENDKSGKKSGGEGKLVRFMLLDAGFKEGVSLANVRYAHLLEPPLIEASLKQAVARSIRFCKSTLLKDYTAPPAGWWVDVYIYRSVYPAYLDDPGGGTKEDPSTVHQAIMDSLGEARKEMKMMASFDNLLKESAVDYALNEAILNYSPPGVNMGADEAAKALNLV